MTNSHASKAIAQAFWLFLSLLPATLHAASLTELGKRLYEEGIDASGKPLAATRFDQSRVEGREAACINCHRKSGMGGVEGATIVQPINNEFLFHRTVSTMAIVDPRIRMGFSMPQGSYTDASAVSAITEGKKLDGTALGPLMPRYQLDSQSAEAIIAYLKTLSATVSPGIGKDHIQFATVIAPGVSQELRDAFKKTVKAYFDRNNLFLLPGGRHHRLSYDVYPRTPRDWRMDFWELQGSPDTWPAQLDTFYRNRPAFALISGLVPGNIEPVHAVCNRQQIPCVFPSTNQPPGQEDRYTFYFSQGVSLEAAILAEHLGSRKDHLPARVLQLVDDDEVARSAAAELTTDLSRHGISSRTVRLAAGSGELAGAIRELTQGDVIMGWVNDGSQLTRLEGLLSGSGAEVYLSTLLSGGEYAPMTDDLRNRVRLVYPFETGQRRNNQEAGFLAWVNSSKVPAVSERYQSEFFFNMLLLSEVVGQMLDNLYREYLAERVEDIISMGFQKSNYAAMSLGPGQRFAARSGYIVRPLRENRVEKISERITP